MPPIEIPENQQSVPWVQSLIRLLQAQAEEIVQLKATVQELRDEITRLKNTLKRPKFRSSRTPSSGKTNNVSGQPECVGTEAERRNCNKASGSTRGVSF